METGWKRCSHCNNLKQINEFWKQGNGFRSWCKVCIREEIDKEVKKEYDRLRYENYKINLIKNKIDYVCMRCEDRYANVRNNQLYWCFDCLEKYENENKQKIKVEVIDKRRRKYTLKWSEYNFETFDGKTIEGFLYDFVNNLENKNIVDEASKRKLLQISRLSNKEDIIKRMINEIELFLDYEENSDSLLVDFPYRKYLNELTKN